MDAPDHCGIEGYGAHARVHQRRAAVDGGQPRAAPGNGRCVAQQRDGDRRDRVKAECHEERRCDGSRRARASRTFEEDGHQHPDHDDLHAAVVADAGDGRFHILDRAGLAQKIQDHECAEYHQHDLEALFDALPDEGIERGDVFGKRHAGDVKVGKCQNERPHQRQRRHAFGGLLEAEDPDQDEEDRCECHDKI